MSTEFLVPVLESLPSYAEVSLLSGDRELARLMARDRPGEGRRFTNLTSGTEWIGMTAEKLFDLGVTSVVFHAFTSEVCQ